jgi:hypothetical protein
MSFYFFYLIREFFCESGTRNKVQNITTKIFTQMKACQDKVAQFQIGAVRAT